MKDKTLWTNIGISAAGYVLWLIITAAIAGILENFCLIIALPLLIAESAYIFYRSRKLMIYPLTAAVTHIIVFAVVLISFSADMDKAISQSEGGADALLGIFVILGGTFAYFAIIAAGIISLIAVFVISIITGAVTKSILNKNSL